MNDRIIEMKRKSMTAHLPEVYSKMYHNPTLFHYLLTIAVLKPKYSFANQSLLAEEMYKRRQDPQRADFKTVSKWKDALKLPKETPTENVIKDSAAPIVLFGGDSSLSEYYTISDLKNPDNYDSKKQPIDSNHLQTIFTELYKLFLCGSPKDESIYWNGFEPVYSYTEWKESDELLVTVERRPQSRDKIAKLSLIRESQDEGLSLLIYEFIKETYIAQGSDKVNDTIFGCFIAYAFCVKHGIFLNEHSDLCPSEDYAEALMKETGISKDRALQKILEKVLFEVEVLEKGIAANRKILEEKIENIEHQRQEEILKEEEEENPYTDDDFYADEEDEPAQKEEVYEDDFMDDAASSYSDEDDTDEKEDGPEESAKPVHIVERKDDFSSLGNYDDNEDDEDDHVKKKLF